MASATTFVQDWLQYWGNLGTRFTTRLEAASTKARRGDYTTHNLLSDSIALWTDGVDAWFTALGRGTAEPAVLMFHFKVGTECKTGSVRVAVPGDAAPACTDLVHVGGGPSIAQANINIKVTRAHDEIVVSLVDLGTARPGPGYYLGLVHVGERPLVVIHAVVTP